MGKAAALLILGFYSTVFNFFPQYKAPIIPSPDIRGVFIASSPTITPKSQFTMLATVTPTLIIVRIPTIQEVATITDTPQPTVVPTSRPDPTSTLQLIIPTPTVDIKPIPTSIIQQVDINDKSTYILNAINNYRKSKGLTEVQTDTFTCDFASVRVKEITTNFNHDGFNNRVSNKSLPYPSYSSIVENIAMTSDYTQVPTMWFDSPGHAANLQADTPNACVGNNDNYFTYEGWKP